MTSTRKGPTAAAAEAWAVAAEAWVEWMARAAAGYVVASVEVKAAKVATVLAVVVQMADMVAA